MKILFLTISLFYCLTLLISDSLIRPFMIDEGMSVQVAVKFFNYLQYAFYPEISAYFGSFEPGMSIGILSTWPGGLGWMLGDTLFASRIAHCFYFLSLISAITLCLPKNIFQKNILFFATASFLVILSLKTIPNFTNNILYGMGEYSGALWYILAVILAFRFPRTASFLLGCVVFHTKFIYLPYCLVALVFIALFHGLNWKKALALISFFLLPIFIWMSLILLQTGENGFRQWWLGRFFHINYAPTGVGPLKPETNIFMNWTDRFTQPQFEWMHYPITMKLKTLFLLFSGFTVCLVFPFLIRAVNFSKNRRFAFYWFSWGHAFLILLFSIWYFFFHAEMWFRHIFPTLVFCFLWVISAAVYYLKTHPVRINSQWWVGLLLLLSLQWIKELHRIYVELSPTDPETLYSIQCKNEEGTRTQGPADMTLEKCGFNFPLEVNLGQKSLKMRY